jgi:hypothetical protein
MGLLDKFKKPKELTRHRAMALVFCPESNPYQMVGQIEELFHSEHTGDRNEISLQQEDMEISMLACGSNDEGENGEYAKKQLEGVAGYVYRSKTELTEIKRNLFYHLRQCKGLLFVSYAFNSAGPAETERKREQVMAVILDIAGKLQGVATFDEGTSLLDSKGRVILDKDGKSQLEYYMPSEVPVPGDWSKDALPEYIERRDRSMALLQDKHIYVTPWLPLLWERAEEPGRTVEEVCGRAAALLIVSLYSECRLGEHMSYEESREFVDPIIEGYRADEFFSPDERAYLNDPESDEKIQIQYAWQYENLWVMEWALGLTDDLFWPTHICDVPESSRIMREHPNMEELTAAARLRPRAELLDQADLIYRLHWACVDARVMGMPAPQELEEGVVMERHRALFWLAGCDEMCPWDDVDLST